MPQNKNQPPKRPSSLPISPHTSNTSPTVFQPEEQPQADGPSLAVSPAYLTAPAPTDPRSLVPESLQPGTHHVHSTYVWLGSLRIFFAILIPVAISIAGTLMSVVKGLSHSQTSSLMMHAWWIGALLIIVVMALCLGGRHLSYKFFFYEFEPAEFSLHSGIINKKRKHVPYQRIQSVNQKASLLQRALGLVDVQIDTAGGSANESLYLPYLRASEAKALRSELFRRKRILLDGGTIDQFGSASVNGIVYPSAWAVACAGGHPATTPAYMPFFAPSDAVSEAATPLYSATNQVTAPAPPITSLHGNVLDAADEALGSIRGIFDDAAIEDDPALYEMGLSNRELLLAGVSGAGGAVGAFLLLIMSAFGLAMKYFSDALGPAIERETERIVMQENITVLSDINLLPFIAFSVAVALFVWVASIIAASLQLGGFRLRRRQNRIEVEFGLLARTFQGVEIDRIQSVVIKQSFIRKLIGYCELSVTKIDSSTAEDNGQKNEMPARGVVIHPFVKMDRVPEIIAGALPEFTAMPHDAVQLPARARRRALIRQAFIRNGAFWFALVLALGLMVLHFFASPQLGVEHYLRLDVVSAVCSALLVAALLVVVLMAANALLWFKRSSLAYNTHYLRITNGGFRVTTELIPRRKIQFAWLRTNPFQRRSHVTTIQVRTAAGIGGTTIRLWDVAKSDAEAWMDWVRPGGAHLSPHTTK